MCGLIGGLKTMARGEIKEFSDIFNKTRHLALKRQQAFGSIGEPRGRWHDHQREAGFLAFVQQQPEIDCLSHEQCGRDQQGDASDKARRQEPPQSRVTSAARV